MQILISPELRELIQKPDSMQMNYRLASFWRKASQEADMQKRKLAEEKRKEEENVQKKEKKQVRYSYD